MNQGLRLLLLNSTMFAIAPRMVPVYKVFKLSLNMY